jgi:hypothetical protein
MRVGLWLCVILCAGFAPAHAQSTGAAAETGAPANPSDAAVTVELNKLEPAANACRAYFVVGNQLPDPLKELQLDVYIFDPKGVIAHRVGLAFTDVRPNRTKVVLFDLADLTCGDIGRLLVNEVLACSTAKGPVDHCADRVAVNTKTAARFEY